MQNLKRSELKQIQILLARAKANELTDDLLLGIVCAVKVNLGPVPQIRIDIVTRLNELLDERRSFRYGMTKKQ